MRRYDINIDCPAGSRVDEATLREVLPRWIEARDEAEAEAMIAAALARWAEEKHEDILMHVTVWAARAHVRARPYGGYGPRKAGTILVRRRDRDTPIGAWMHVEDADVPVATWRGIRAGAELGATAGVWRRRPWDDDGWEWEDSAAGSGRPSPIDGIALTVRADTSPAGQDHHLVMAVAIDGHELTWIGCHARREAALEHARRESVQLRLPLLVPEQEEHEHV